MQSRSEAAAGSRLTPLPEPDPDRRRDQPRQLRRAARRRDGNLVGINSLTTLKTQGQGFAIGSICSRSRRRRSIRATRSASSASTSSPTARGSSSTAPSMARRRPMPGSAATPPRHRDRRPAGPDPGRLLQAGRGFRARPDGARSAGSPQRPLRGRPAVPLALRLFEPLRRASPSGRRAVPGPRSGEPVAEPGEVLLDLRQLGARAARASTASSSASASAVMSRPSTLSSPGGGHEPDRRLDRLAARRRSGGRSTRARGCSRRSPGQRNLPSASLRNQLT